MVVDYGSLIISGASTRVLAVDKLQYYEHNNNAIPQSGIGAQAEQQRSVAVNRPYATPAATQLVVLERGSNGCLYDLVGKLIEECTLRVVASHLSPRQSTDHRIPGGSRSKNRQ